MNNMILIGEKPLTKEAKQRAILNEYGVACSTAYGDGSYPCLIYKNNDNRVVAVVHEYICEEDEEEA